MSDVEERCERSDLLVSQCAHCKGHDLGLKAPSQVYVGYVAKASYTGLCALDRSHSIEPGDRIGQSEHGWLCWRCVDVHRP